MRSNQNPRANRHSNYTVADLKNMARGRWPEILRAAGVPADALDGHKGRPCPRCGGHDRFCPLPDVIQTGAVLCRYCHNASTEPRCGDGVAALRWWLGVDVANAIRWLSSYLGVGGCDHARASRPVERRLAIPEQTDAHERFRLLAEVCRRNMRPTFLRRAAELLGLSTESLERLQVGWSPAHRATTWPMRDADGAVIGVRLRCPTTARKWAVTGSSAGLFYPIDLLSIERPKRLYVCEGPTDSAALMSIGLAAVGAPSAGGCRDIVTQLSRRVLPAEVVIVADADGPGLAGAERLADALMIVAKVRIVSPVAVKDARAWVVAGADRAVIESAVDRCSVRSIAMEGVSNE